jgi:surface antigen
MIRKILLAVMLCVTGAGLAAAEVADSSAGGFTVKTTLSIQAAPDEVYRRLIHIGDWWDSAHTFSGDAHNLSIEEKAGGCFCEKLPNGGSVRHLEVLFLAPGKTLRMGGGLGPLQGIAASGSMTIKLSPAGVGTKLETTYAVAGYLPSGMNTLAAPVDTVLTGQFVRLKNYVERGDPAKGEPAKGEAEKQK